MHLIYQSCLISPCYCGVILYDMIQWIINTNSGNIGMMNYLNDDDVTRNMNKGFSRISNGILKGAIGVLYGWLVRIERPS